MPALFDTQTFVTYWRERVTGAVLLGLGLKLAVSER